MSFAVLEKEVQSLPVELQNNIEMYALFVINTFKQSSSKFVRRRSASEAVDFISGIISGPVSLTMRDVHAERLSAKYGV